MKNIKENIFYFITATGAFLSGILVLVVFFYIFKESIPFLKEVGWNDFLLGDTWSPMSEKAQYSFLPMILATLYVSFMASTIAVIMGTGCGLFLTFCVKEKYSKIILSFIDMLAGIPSVIFGFLGLVLLVKFMETHLGMVSGESVLAGGLLLSVMLFPYVVTGCAETFVILKDKYLVPSTSLGVSKWYCIRRIILPAACGSIFVNMLLALSRALGETMAVMMVMGNSPVFPRLLGRAETIPSLIALEMGTATYKSIHYSALYAGGLILVILITIIQAVAYRLKKAMSRGDENEN